MSEAWLAAERFLVAPGAAIAPQDPLRMGFKAANLARMAALGLPVPPAVVLGTGFHRARREDAAALQARLPQLLEEEVGRLERATGLRFGAGRLPLLVSVRSGAPVSMPGMMDTILNIGLTETSLSGMLRATGNPRLVWDAWRRLIQQFAEVVHGASPRPFAEVVAEVCRRAGVGTASELDFAALRHIGQDFLALHRELTGQRFPQRADEQLLAAVEAVLASWDSPRAIDYRRLNGIDDALGTAVTIQRMVFGNAGGTSGAGVGFTRDPASGEDVPYLDFMFNAQGEDVVSGRHAMGTGNDAAALGIALPEVVAQLGQVRGELEAAFGDMQEFEFTVENGHLFLLQTRSGKRTPWAALRIAVERVRAGQLQPAEALRQLADLRLEAIVRRRLAGSDAPGASGRLARATPAGTGVASGVVALDPQAAREFSRRGEPAILVRDDISTTDVDGIAAAAGILTARGSRTAHAAVVARAMDKVCLVGCRELRCDLKARRVELAGRQLAEGEWLTLDADDGAVYVGRRAVVEERPEAWLAEVARWKEAAAVQA
jgi:pyruvate,orthophosphate dikinase